MVFPFYAKQPRRSKKGKWQDNDKLQQVNPKSLPPAITPEPWDQQREPGSDDELVIHEWKYDDEDPDAGQFR